MENKHTPLPWKIGEHRRVEANGDTLYLSCGVAMPSDNHPRKPEADANAEYIVKAANLAPKLAESLEWFISAMHDDSVDDMAWLVNEMERRAAESLSEWNSD